MTRRRPCRGARQRGVALIFTLLALVIMLIGAVALVRSFNASLATAGNLGFQRDVMNQSERAAAIVLPEFDSGALSTPAARAGHVVARNYRATLLPNNAQGIPLALLSDAAFAAVADPANDIVVADQNVTIRYVVDRLCDALGDETTLTPAQCAVPGDPNTRPGSASEILSASLPPQFLYRLSIRVTGPRNTQAFYQSTFAL